MNSIVLANKAYYKVILSLDSKREISLGLLGELPDYCRIIKQKKFVDENNQSVCCSQYKFLSLEDVDNWIKKTKEENAIIYLYKLEEYDVYGSDLTPTGEKRIILTSSVREKVKPKH
jgi:reverse gyrase